MQLATHHEIADLASMLRQQAQILSGQGEHVLARQLDGRARALQSFAASASVT